MTKLKQAEMDAMEYTIMEEAVKQDVIRTQILSKKLELYTLAAALVPAILEEIKAKAKP